MLEPRSPFTIFGSSGGGGISLPPSLSLPHISLRIAKVVFHCLHFLAIVLANVATCGTYGAIKHILRQRHFEKIERDQAEKAFEYEQQKQRYEQQRQRIVNLQAEQREKESQLQISQEELRKAKIEKERWSAEKRGLSEKVEALSREQTESQALRAKCLRLEASVRAHDAEVSGLGPIAPMYKRRPMPTEAETTAGIQFDVRYHDAEIIEGATRWKNCYKYIQIPESNNLNKMEELIKVAHKTCFEELLSNPSVKLNRSAHISYEIDRVHAIYAYMVYDLISQAGLEHDACEGHVLNLNNALLQIGYSDPFNVLSRKKPSDPLEARTFYKHLDAWTPKEIDNFPTGIDPISVKWILERLNPEAKEHLKYLILDALIPNTNEKLALAKIYSSSRSENGNLVRIAHLLIKDMAKAIGKNFGTHLSETWSQVAPDEEAEVPTIDKRRDIPVVTETLTAWNPDYSIISRELQEIVQRTQQNLSMIWNHLSRETLQNPLTRCPATAPSYEFLHTGTYGQFYKLHTMIGNFGCLLSALTASLTLDQSKFTNNTVDLIKIAMLNYLTRHQHEPDIRAIIAEEYKDPRDPLGLDPVKTQQSAMDNYLKWLRDEVKRDKNQFGLREILLFSLTFGIRVEVFQPNVSIKTNEAGLIEIDRLTAGKLLCVGPSTKEKIILFHNPGSVGTYYALAPRVKTVLGSESSAEYKAAVKQYSSFWLDVDGKDLYR